MADMLCADSDRRYPCYRETARAVRCKFHRRQRERWTAANATRRHRGQPELLWDPVPLTPRSITVSPGRAEYLDEVLARVGRSRVALARATGNASVARVSADLVRAYLTDTDELAEAVQDMTDQWHGQHPGPVFEEP